MKGNPSRNSNGKFVHGNLTKTAERSAGTLVKTSDSLSRNCVYRLSHRGSRCSLKDRARARVSTTKASLRLYCERSVRSIGKGSVFFIRIQYSSFTKVLEEIQVNPVPLVRRV